MAISPFAQATRIAGCEDDLAGKVGLAFTGPCLSADSTPLRVLHVHSGNLYGGVETTLLAQARHRDDPYRPSMRLSFALCFPGRFSEELISDRSAVHWLGPVRVRNPMSVCRARKSLGQLLRRTTFDVVVTHSSWSQAIFGPAVQAVGLPLVRWFHGRVQAHHWLDRWAFRTHPTLAICNSHFTAQSLSNFDGTIPYEVIYCPYVAAESNEAIGDRRTTRASLETGEDEIVIIQVSRLEPAKGHALHLEALGLMKDLPGWISWIVGGPQQKSERKYWDQLKSLAAKLGIANRIRFPGERSDVPELLAAADIYCQPNTGPESFGLTLIEALNARLPVVTTAMGGALEVVDESCGVFVDPTASEIGKALEQLVLDAPARIRLGSGGPVRAVQLCDLAEQMQKINNVLTQLSRLAFV